MVGFISIFALKIALTCFNAILVGGLELLAKTELLDETGLELSDVMAVLAIPSYLVIIQLLFFGVEAATDKHREASPTLMVLVAIGAAAYVLYISGTNFDLAFDSLQDIYPVFGLSAALLATGYLIAMKPFPIETIYCIVIVGAAAFPLQVANVVLGCASLLVVASLVIFGSARPSKTRIVMLLYIVLAFSGSTANEARASIAELYDVLLSPTDINALSVYLSLFTSEAISVSYARVPLILTGTVCTLARYFVAFCLAATLHETSYYSLVTSSTGSQKLIASVRAMVFSSGKANTRSLLLMVIIMVMNLVAVIAYSILQLVMGEYEHGAPISKRAVAAAAHAIQGSQTTELGDAGAGVVIPIEFSGRFPDLEASPSLLTEHQSFMLHQVSRRFQEAIGGVPQAKKKRDFQTASTPERWLAQATKALNGACQGQQHLERYVASAVDLHAYSRQSTAAGDLHPYDAR